MEKNVRETFEILLLGMRTYNESVDLSNVCDY